MKKGYLLLFLFITAHIVTLAQRNVDIGLRGIRYGTSSTNLQPLPHHAKLNYDNKTEYFFAFMIENKGPNVLFKYDTVTVYFRGKVFQIDQYVLNPGDSVLFTPNANSFVFPIPTGKIMPSSDTLYLCDSISVKADISNGAIIDGDKSNNLYCRYTDAYYSWPLGVDDVADRHRALMIYPNPATTSLTINYAYSGEPGNARIILRNILGMEVYTRWLENTSGDLSHTIDISRLAGGFYTAELYYNHQTIFQKFSIQ